MTMDTLHVAPTDDLIAHDTDSEGCICGPNIVTEEQDDGTMAWVLVHHSLDGREMIK